MSAITALPRRTLVAGAVIVGALVVLGIVQGVVWAAVAPGQQAKVFADGSYASLPTADYHPFTALALFVLAGVAVGLVAAAAVWRVRSIRGTATLLILLLGAAAGAAVAYGIGLALVNGVDPASIGSTGHESIVVAAPKLASLLVLVAEPAAAVALYTFLVAWDGRPGLGRRDEPDGAGVARAIGESRDASVPGAAPAASGGGDAGTHGGSPVAHPG